MYERINSILCIHECVTYDVRDPPFQEVIVLVILELKFFLTVAHCHTGQNTNSSRNCCTFGTILHIWDNVAHLGQCCTLGAPGVVKNFFDIYTSIFTFQMYSKQKNIFNPPHCNNPEVRV